MVRVYKQHVSRVHKNGYRSDNAAGAKTGPADGNVRFVGNAGADRNLAVAVDSDENVDLLLINCAENGGDLVFTVRVITRASKSEVVGEHDGNLKVRISSPPVDGAANSELVRLFAKTLGVSKSAVSIVSGHSSKTKQIRINGVTAAQLRSVAG